MIFSMKGSTEKCLHGAYSASPLKMMGHFVMQGPQPVGVKGGVPQWVADLMESNPDIKQIAISTDTGGSIWSRMEESTNEK